MYQKNLIEITQDAACVIENKSEASGVFTANVQTCLIYLIQTNQALIAIHDSGQLSLSSIEKIAKGYGKITSINLVFGPDLNKANQERLPELVSLIGYEGEINTYKSGFQVFSISFKVKDTEPLI